MVRARRARLFAATMLFYIGIAASAAEPLDPLQQAIRARESGDYKTAVRLLRTAAAEHPHDASIGLFLAETLAWDKQFPEAELTYREILKRQPSSRAQLGLARVLLWRGEYVAATAEFSRLVQSNAEDVDALEGRATAEYWSGDFRAAARDFRAALAIEPSRQLSRRSLSEIELAARPEQRVSSGAVDDDQPYRLWRTDAAASISTDPLTRWNAVAGTYRAATPLYGAASMPFAEIGNETGFPSLRLTAAAHGGFLRYADGVIRPIGGLRMSRRIFSNAAIYARIEKQELLATATGMRTHPSVARYAMGWRRDSTERWNGAAEAAILRYFDGNRGTAVYAYGLVPLFGDGNASVSLGASGAYNDTRDSRFAFEAVSSVRVAPGTFAYDYRGSYSPYWAPERLREARAVVVGVGRVRSAEIQLHLDGGVARDRAVAFGPSSGSSALPSYVFPVHFERTFHPYRAALTLTAPLTRDIRIEAGVESTSTVFYRARNFHASLVRHR